MSSFCQLSCFSPLTNLFQNLYPRCAHLSAKMGLDIKQSGRSRLIRVWHHPLTFDPQRSLSVHVQFFPHNKEEKYMASCYFTHNLALLYSYHAYYLKVSTGDKVWLIYPVSVVTYILEGKQEADCKCLTWSPPISCLRKCKQKASGNYPARSPHFSCQKICKQVASCKCLAWTPFVFYFMTAN